MWRQRELVQATRTDLVWVAISFVLLQGALALALARWYPELFDPAYGYKAAALKRHMSTPRHDCSVVMVGSSRTVFGFRAPTLADAWERDLGRPVLAFNFGTYGGGPLRQWLNLRRLIEAGIRPDLLLVEVVPPLLAGQPGAPREIQQFNPAQLGWRELQVEEEAGISPWSARGAWLEARLAPWHAHRFAILNRLAPRWLPPQLQQDWGPLDNPTGWVPLPSPPASDAARAEALRMAHHRFSHYLQGFQLGGPPCQALRELLEYCRRDALPTVLVLMPEGPSFRSWYPPEALEQIQHFVTGLTREFGVPVIDARQWSDEEEFSDSHHLLPAGAQRFTLRLSRSPVLRSLVSLPEY